MEFSIAVGVGLVLAAILNLLRDSIEPYFMSQQGHEREENPVWHVREFWWATVRAAKPSPFAIVSTPTDRLPVFVRLLIGRRQPQMCLPRHWERAVATGIVLASVLILYSSSEFGWTFIARAFFVVGTLLIGWVCRDTVLLPFVFTVPLLVAGVVLSATIVPFVDLRASLIGVAIGYAVPWAIRFLYFWSGREALSYGIVVLSGALGAWLGWEGAVVSFLAGTVLVTAKALYIRWRLRRAGDTEADFPAQMSFGNLMAAPAVVYALLIAAFQLN